MYCGFKDPDLERDEGFVLLQLFRVKVYKQYKRTVDFNSIYIRSGPPADEKIRIWNKLKVLCFCKGFGLMCTNSTSVLNIAILFISGLATLWKRRSESRKRRFCGSTKVSGQRLKVYKQYKCTVDLKIRSWNEIKVFVLLQWFRVKVYEQTKCTVDFNFIFIRSGPPADEKIRIWNEMKVLCFCKLAAFVIAQAFLGKQGQILHRSGLKMLNRINKVY